MLIITSLSPIILLQNSELVEDDANGEVGGDDGLERSESPKSWIQKILGSARMGGISGPLVSVYRQNIDTYRAYCHRADTGLFLLNVPLLTQLIQPSILFNDNLDTSVNKGGLVDGVESEVSNSSSNLTSPSSRAVVARDEDSGVSIHSIVNDKESTYVSEPGVNKDVLPEPKNLSLKLKSDDDGQVDPSVQDTTVDVSTIVHVSLSILGILFLNLLLLV